MPNRLDERRIHITDALASRILFLHEIANGNLNEFLQHIIFRLGLIVFAGQHHIDTGRMHGDVGDLREILDRSTAMKAVGIRNKLSNQVGNLRIGTTGHQGIRQI